MSELHRVVVRHPGGDYEVVIGVGALDSALSEYESWWQQRTVFLVTSETVASLWAEPTRACLARSATRVVPLIVPDGEAAKELEVAGELWRSMLRQGGKRDSRVVALGGGAVGDLAGFVAGTFLRGVEVLQLPTTLLAQVDASVGGKTAIDLPEGKNTVGLFVQPRGVIADTELLSSLPEGELRAGLFEVIKMAFLLDPELLEQTETCLGTLLEGQAGPLAGIVAGAVAAKAGVVELDPTERDERRLLNFGHTLAHAIEAVQGYSSLRHGEAVGYGMLFALRLSCRRGLDGQTAQRLHALIARLGLPPLEKLETSDLIAAMARDKKARESGVSWVLAQALGEGKIVEDLAWSTVEEELQAYLADPWAPPV